MHILLLNDDAPPRSLGGASVIVDALRKGLTEANHKVTLITSHQDARLGEELRSSDSAGETISLHIDYPIGKRHRKCLYIKEVSSRLKELFDELRPDVINAHNVHTHLTYDSLCIARIVTDKVFLTAHDTFLVSFDRVRSDKAKRMFFWDHLRDAGRKYWPLRNRKIKSILKSSVKKVISISHATEDFFHANGITNTTVIPNGIASRPLPSQEEVDAFKSRYNLTGPTVFFGGRIRHDKGAGVLIDAIPLVLAKVPDAKFLIVGEEKHMESYLKIASDDVKKSLCMTGWLPYKDMPLTYAASNVVITPSIYLDNFPTVNLEAMMFARPVVGTSFGGTKEAIENNLNGFIRDPRNTESFADAIITLLSDSELAEKMGSAGRTRFENQFTLKRMVGDYVNAYESL
jgi:glycosyltransferase involved in cell wall biosynthesis